MTRWPRLLLRSCLLVMFGSFLTGCLTASAPGSSPRLSEFSLNSADGRQQARSQSGGGVSRIELLSPSVEQPSATLDLPGEVVWMAWHPSSDLLLVTSEIQAYSFGANFKVQLYRWNGQDPPSSRLLTDTTLKPLTLARWQTRLPALPGPVLSPQRDVLAFLRLHDPPAFDPYLKVVLISLDGKGELVLGNQAMPGVPLSFTADGETLRWAEGDGRTVEVQPWLGPSGLNEIEKEATESVDPALLQMRQLLLQGLLNQDDYRLQWQQRRQP